MKNNTKPFALYNKVLRLGGGTVLLFIALCLLFSCDSSTPGSGDSDGSNTVTYHIRTEQDLRAWAESEDCSTANVILENDITLTSSSENETNWTPVRNYTGTFDGQGHTITDVSVVILESGSGTQNQGFFRSIKGGVVKDLILENIYIHNLSGYIGGIAGSSDGGSISSCTVSGTISSGGGGYAGGIIGHTSGATTTISNCINSCDVISVGTDATAGGIAGYARIFNISECKNYGDITVRGYNSVKGGGIAGHILDTAVNSCLNSGNIIGENNTKSTTPISQYLYLGAIVGAAYGSSSTITDCTIEEGCTIEATHYPAYIKRYSVGNFVGYGGGDDSTNKGTATIKEIKK